MATNGFSVGRGIESTLNVAPSRYGHSFVAHPLSPLIYIFGGYGVNGGKEHMRLIAKSSV